MIVFVLITCFRLLNMRYIFYQNIHFLVSIYGKCKCIYITNNYFSVFPGTCYLLVIIL